MKIFKLNQNQIKEWEKTRQSGRLKFYLKWILSIGIVIPIFVTLYNIFILSASLEILPTAILVVICLFGGLMIGILNWSLMEYGYKISNTENTN